MVVTGAILWLTKGWQIILLLYPRPPPAPAFGPSRHLVCRSLYLASTRSMQAFTEIALFAAA